ncbi:MAG: tail fiber domain-containing protein [Bacteroidia bacterium]
MAVRAQAQSIAVNASGAAANSSSILDVSVSSLATKKGMLIPRMTSAQKTAMNPLPAAAQGLVIYQTDGVEGFYYNTSTTTTPNWLYLVNSSTGSWLTTGNSGTTASTAAIGSTVNNNFIGTTDLKDFVFATNNLERMRILSTGHVGIGVVPVGNKLHVVCTTGSDNAIFADHQSTSTTATYYGVGATLSGFSTTLGYLAYHNSSNVRYAVYGNGGDLAGYFSGLVGINSTPTALTTNDLEIRNSTAGATAVNVGFRQTTSVTTSGNTLANLNFGDNHQLTAEAQIQVIRGAAGGAGDLPTSMLFYTTPDASATLTERMRITQAGNVGIANAAPSEKLDVTGNVRFSGALMPNNLAGTSGQVLTSQGAGVAPIWAAAGSGSGWALTGNAGTSSAANFIGTTDNIPFSIKVNSVYSGRISVSGVGNTSFGYNANNISGTTSEVDNTAFGDNALAGNLLLTQNTAVGSGAMASQALAQPSGQWNSENTAVGYYALHSNAPTDMFNDGFWNTAVGSGASQNNTTGFYNTAIGRAALQANISGDANVAIGTNSMLSSNLSTVNNNTAVGTYTLTSDLAPDNVAIGYYALRNSVYGSQNVAVGREALGVQTSPGAGAVYASNNVAVGYRALFNTNGASATTGISNTGIGYSAGSVVTTGTTNTYVGYNANPSGGNFNNSGAFGASAIAPGANDTYRMGSAAVTSIGGQVGWTTISDKRVKINVQQDIPGLAFIRQLKPVSYNYDVEREMQLLGMKQEPEQDNEITAMKFSGFLAQDVDASAQSIGYDFSGVDRPKNANGLYGLRYAEFVVPLVKSVQELDEENQQLKSQISALAEDNKEIKEELDRIRTLLEANNK